MCEDVSIIVDIRSGSNNSDIFSQYGSGPRSLSFSLILAAWVCLMCPCVRWYVRARMRVSVGVLCAFFCVRVHACAVYVRVIIFAYMNILLK